MENLKWQQELYDFSDAVQCYCESQNGGTKENGIVCEVNGTTKNIGSCKSDEWCTGNLTKSYSTRLSQFCEKGK